MTIAQPEVDLLYFTKIYVFNKSSLSAPLFIFLCMVTNFTVILLIHNNPVIYNDVHVYFHHIGLLYRRIGKIVLSVGAALRKSFSCPRLVLGLSSSVLFVFLKLQLYRRIYTVCYLF